MSRLATALLLVTGCVPHLDPGPIPALEAQAPVSVVTLDPDGGQVVHMQAMVRAGSAFDPIGSEGLAHLTARSIIEAGAGERDSDQVRAALYPTGNQFGLVVSREWVSVRLECHVDHAELCVDLFTQALTAPQFDAGDVIRLREDAEQHVNEGLLASEEALGSEVFEASVYEGHPYGHPVEGRGGVLPGLSADDARAFHRTHFVRSAVWVGLGGQWSEALHDRLVEGLRPLPRSPAPELVLMSPPTVDGPSLVAVDVDTQVTGVHLGHAIRVDRNHADWPALTLGATILGAHRQSFGRLFQTIRTDRGLNYGDYAYAEPFVQRGWSTHPEQGVLRSQPYFQLWVRPTSVANGPFALKLAIDELERFIAEGPEPDEFEDVRAWLSSAVALWAQDSGRRLAYTLDARATGTPQLLDTLPDALSSLTPEQVTEAMQRHVHLDELVIVAVTGDADGFVSAVIEDDATPIVYGDVEPNDAQATQDTSISERDLGLDPKRAWVVPAQGVFR